MKQNQFGLFMIDGQSKQLQKFYLTYHVLGSQDLIFEVFDDCKKLLKIIKFDPFEDYDAGTIILEDVDFNNIIAQATGETKFFECAFYGDGFTILNWTIDPAEYSC